MARYILIAIDGTGSLSWGHDSSGDKVSITEAQSKRITNSFTNLFYQDFDCKGGMKKYWNGPSNEATGSDSESIMNEIDKFILDSTAKLLPKLLKIRMPRLMAIGSINTAPVEEKGLITNSDIQFVLVGHSRGGAICIQLAKKIEENFGKKVYFMGLYDAVDMSTYIEGWTTVISGVRFVYHARRHPRAGSRASFKLGYTGLLVRGAEDSETREYWTSHGGVGGDPSSKTPGLTGDYSCVESLSLFSPITSNELIGRISNYIVHQGTPVYETCRFESNAANTFIRTKARLRNLTFSLYP